MNLLAPVLRLEVGGREVFHRITGPVALVARRTAPLDAAVIAAALPAARRWRLRLANADGPVPRAQLADGNNLLIVADLDEPGVGELLVTLPVPVVAVGVRGAYAVGGLRDIVRRRLPHADDRPRVAVRFAGPIDLPAHATAAAEAAGRACDRLVAEDETTWWASLREQATEQPGHSTTGRPNGAAAGWRAAWHQTGPARRGGPVTRRRIWG